MRVRVDDPGSSRDGTGLRLVRRSDGAPLRLRPELELGAGGEARVYAVPGDERVVAKLYHHPIEAYARKIAFMIAHPPADPLAVEGEVSIAWPLDLLTDERGRFAGLLVPRVDDTRKLFEVYNPATRRERATVFHYGHLHRIGRNLAAAVQALHEGGYVVGDLNESNLLISPRAGVTVVDTDSFQVRDTAGVVYRCVVGRPEYTPPELQRRTFAEVDRTPEHDRFGLGVLLFHLLMEGTHPFAGSVRTTRDPPPLEARIRAGAFPYARRNPVAHPPRTAPPFELLHPGVRELFVRCFEDGHTDPSVRPSAGEWRDGLEVAERALVTCDSNLQHCFGEHLGTCPWCERAAALEGRDPFPSRAMVARGAHLVAPPSASPAVPRASAPSSAASPLPTSLPSSLAWFRSLFRPVPLASVPPQAWGWAALVLAVLLVAGPTFRIPLALMGALGGVIRWRRSAFFSRVISPPGMVGLLVGALTCWTMFTFALHPDRLGLGLEDPPPPIPQSLTEPPIGIDVSRAEVKPKLLNAAEVQRVMQAAYPARFAEEGITGETTVRFVIDENGLVDPSSIIVESSDAFGTAARMVVEVMRFKPARLEGKPVPVVVTMPITWTLERTP